MATENNTRFFVNRQFLFSVLDLKAGQYKGLNLSTSKTDALRNFEAESQNPQSMLARHPSEYNLCCMGEYHDNGTIIAYDKPEILASASEFAKTQNPVNLNS